MTHWASTSGDTWHLWSVSHNRGQNPYGENVLSVVCSRRKSPATFARAVHDALRAAAASRPTLNADAEFSRLVYDASQMPYMLSPVHALCAKSSCPRTMRVLLDALSAESGAAVVAASASREVRTRVGELAIASRRDCFHSLRKRNIVCMLPLSLPPYTQHALTPQQQYVATPLFVLCRGAEPHAETMRMLLAAEASSETRKARVEALYGHERYRTSQMAADDFVHAVTHSQRLPSDALTQDAIVCMHCAEIRT